MPHGETLGLVSIGDFYFNDVFASFDNIPKGHFFPQIFTNSRFCVQKKKTNCQFFTNAPLPSDLGTILTVDHSAKGSVSELFNLIVNLLIFLIAYIYIVWSQDIGTDINKETWKGVLNKVNSSLCTCHRLICKVVHRAYWSSRLARINPSIEPECQLTGVILVQLL